MARMNWSGVQRDKSLRNPPRPELDSPIPPKGRHPIPAPPLTPKVTPPEDAPPKDQLRRPGRPKARRLRLRTPGPRRQRSTFTCVGCRTELPISQQSVGFPKRCSSCVRGVPRANPRPTVPPRLSLAARTKRRPDGPPCPQRAQVPRRTGHQIVVDRDVMWQASSTYGWAHPG